MENPSTQPQKLLYTKSEAMKMLGVGEKVFNQLAISYVWIGRRKKYAQEDLQNYISSNRKSAVCLSPVKEKARRTTGMTSRLGVIGFEEARKRIASKQRKPSSLN